MDRYPAKYTDEHGTEDTVITNDGETLRISIRGAEFAGSDFDSLEPLAGTTSEQLQSFVLCHGALCSCRIQFTMAIRIHDNGQNSSGSLIIDLRLGGSATYGSFSREGLSIVLEYNKQLFASSGESGWFELELLEIQKRLPNGTFMQTCINCLYADYSPFGNGLFGHMMCFRNIKQEYLQVTSKDEFWRVHDRYEQLVQETYWCAEFERRVAGTGYRG